MMSTFTMMEAEHFCTHLHMLYVYNVVFVNTMATFKRVLVSTLAVLGWAASVANATSYKVDIVVHYELICPHSQEIVKDQAVPAWRQLRQIMNLMMIPYGNTVAQVVDNSTIPPVLNYSCQHGEPECFGNAIMACALHELPPDFAHEYVFCMYNHSNWHDPYTSAPECAKQQGLDYKFLENCATGRQGGVIQWQNDKKMRSLKPLHTYVPWVTVDGRHSETLQNKAQNNMIKMVCGQFRGLVKPAICNETGEEEPERAPIGITFENDPMNFPVENSSKTSTTSASGQSDSTGKTTPCHVFSSSHHHGDATTAGGQSKTTAAAETTTGHVTHDKSHDTTTAAEQTDGSTTAHHKDGTTAAHPTDGSTGAHHTDGSSTAHHTDGTTEAVHQSTLPCRVTVITEDSSGATHAKCASSQKVVQATVPPMDDSTTHHPPQS